MMTAQEFHDLVDTLDRTIVRAEHIGEPWARLRPINLVAHELVVEAVEDLVDGGAKCFTVKQIWERIQGHRMMRYRYGAPCWSTVDSSLRKMTAAGFVRLVRAGRPGIGNPRVYKIAP